MSNVIKISNVTVERVFKGGFMGSVEFKKRDGSTGRQWFKVWSDSTVSEGGIVDVSGSASARLNEYTDRNGVKQQTAELNINDASVIVSGTPF